MCVNNTVSCRTWTHRFECAVSLGGDSGILRMILVGLTTNPRENAGGSLSQCRQNTGCEV